MPRNKPLKTNRVRAKEVVVKSAIHKVLSENIPFRVAAEMFNLCKSSLCRHIGEAKKQGDAFSSISPTTVPNKVFTTKQESELEEYLI